LSSRVLVQEARFGTIVPNWGAVPKFGIYPGLIGTIVPITRRRRAAMIALLEVGERVRARRRDLGLTQQTLADLAGCSPRFVRSMESGKPTVRLDKVVDVLDVLGLELTTKLRGS
jgi:y4mF family transcriptional regulator